MGAFDGLVPSSYFWANRASTPVVDDHVYIRNQSGFSFDKRFGLPDFELLVNNALSTNNSMVWVPGTQGKVGLSTWYAQAVLDRLKQGLTV